MTSTFESSIREIQAPQQAVYDMLSNLQNIEKVRDRIPEDKLKDFSFDNDSISINVAPVGAIRMHIIEREEPKTIKFEAEQSPLPFNFWIQLLPVTDTSSKMKLTIKADINPFLKGMISKPLQEGLEKIADALTLIHYE